LRSKNLHQIMKFASRMGDQGEKPSGWLATAIRSARPKGGLRESDCVQSPTETHGAPKVGRGAYKESPPRTLAPHLLRGAEGDQEGGRKAD
jgi:hypothetical protein